MSDFLWSKPGLDGPDEAVQKFMAGDDVRLDRHLFGYDIEATRAHANGLSRIGILTPDEAQRIGASLDDLAAQFESGEFRLGPPHEDGHSAIEAWLIDRLDDLGRKVHTGRSRNDQVQVALRLYMRNRLRRLATVNDQIARRLLERAEEGQAWPMPGYTHLQQAVPSTVGHWFAGLAEAFIDNALLAIQTRNWLDSSPLGSAAGFGVNLELDREGVAEELGFPRVQWNPQYVQNSRGRFELQALMALAQSTLELRRFAWDLSLFATEEFAFVRMSDEFVTGSSIMPNKRNPDAVELLRAVHPVVAGALTEIQSALALPSGYHRDLQATKGPLIRAFEAGLQALALVPGLVDGIEFDLDRMRVAIGKDAYATDIAIEKARAGRPFREAYREAPSAEELASRRPEDSVGKRVSPGACGDLRTRELWARLEDLDLPDR